jgi:hypothetical protein
MAIVVHSPGRWVESCHQLTSIFMAELCIFGMELGAFGRVERYLGCDNHSGVHGGWLLAG